MLSIENLSLNFGKKPVLQNLFFSVKAGTHFCIIGESGAGKTSLIRVLQGLYPISSGSVTYQPTATSEKYLYKQGKSFFGLPKSAWVMQNPMAALNPKMRLFTSLTEAFYQQSLSKDIQYQQITNVLMDVGLSVDILQRYPSEISMGQAQRICLARALLTGAKLIFLDEPLSALDALIQKQVAQTMWKIQQKFDLTFVTVTHDLGFVQAYGTELLLLRHGQQEACQAVDQFFQAPDSTYGLALVQAARALGNIEPEKQGAGISKAGGMSIA